MVLCLGAADLAYPAKGKSTSGRRLPCSDLRMVNVLVQPARLGRSRMVAGAAMAESQHDLSTRACVPSSWRSPSWSLLIS